LIAAKTIVSHEPRKPFRNEPRNGGAFRGHTFLLFSPYMTETFTPRLDTLPKPQRRLWDELTALPPEFVLYGGTAIALHLGHRQSVDFNFFGNRLFDPEELATAVSFLDAATITHQEPNTLTVLVHRGGPVKLSFFGLPRLPRLAPPQTVPGNGLKIASLLDLAGTKASVVQRRAEAKDYHDIDAILSGGRIDLPTALAAAKAIYGARFNPQITLKALSYYGEGTLRRLPRAVKDRLTKAAREVDLDGLPTITCPKRNRR
jgi:Nucleotidyl transferase AbiEii toxin, Type IV TA system